MSSKRREFNRKTRHLSNTGPSRGVQQIWGYRREPTEEDACWNHHHRLTNGKEHIIPCCRNKTRVVYRICCILWSDIGSTVVNPNINSQVWMVCSWVDRRNVAWKSKKMASWKMILRSNFPILKFHLELKGRYNPISTLVFM